MGTDATDPQESIIGREHRKIKALLLCSGVLMELTRALRRSWPTPQEIEADRAHHLRMIDPYRRVKP
jgi:hypothetical protein